MDSQNEVERTGKYVDGISTFFSRCDLTGFPAETVD